MIVSVASGKGGTGKTTIAVNLALSLSNVQVIDCDVEEPNCHIFLNTTDKSREDVEVWVPKVDESKCTYCGRCSDFCQYNALAVANGVFMEFLQLCHSCRGCVKVCPENALTSSKRKIGQIIGCRHNEVELIYGLLDIGEAMASPIIRRLKAKIDTGKTTIIDAPPGTSCAVIESVKGSDYCVLVTEPTPFGLNDLKLAVEMLKTMDIPHGVVINRDGIGDAGVEEFCREKNIKILMRIPQNMRIAQLYSEGVPFIYEMTEYKTCFNELFEKIRGT
ncbi:MAG: ATP-binding protein [Candidatus Altiarchaeota archaeon]|nr:ATP-binding protein [Candidatus Altiarchaeota archaeon]